MKIAKKELKNLVRRLLEQGELHVFDFDETYQDPAEHPAARWACREAGVRHRRERRTRCWRGKRFWLRVRDLAGLGARGGRGWVVCYYYSMCLLDFIHNL